MVVEAQLDDDGNGILAVVTGPLLNRKFDWLIRADGQNKSLQYINMLATCAVYG